MAAEIAFDPNAAASPTMVFSKLDEPLALLPPGESDPPAGALPVAAPGDKLASGSPVCVATGVQRGVRQ